MAAMTHLIFLVETTLLNKHFTVVTVVVVIVRGHDPPLPQQLVTMFCGFLLSRV